MNFLFAHAKSVFALGNPILLKHEFNPYLTNGFSHHYQLGESTSIFRGVRSDF